MRPGAKQKQFEFFLLDPVYQEPVRLDMTFTKSGIITSQVMITVLLIQLLLACKCIYNFSQQVEV